jgi:hypothetical protein
MITLIGVIKFDIIDYNIIKLNEVFYDPMGNSI